MIRYQDLLPGDREIVDQEIRHFASREIALPRSLVTEVARRLGFDTPSREDIDDRPMWVCGPRFEVIVGPKFVPVFWVSNDGLSLTREYSAPVEAAPARKTQVPYDTSRHGMYIDEPTPETVTHLEEPTPPGEVARFAAELLRAANVPSQETRILKSLVLGYSQEECDRRVTGRMLGAVGWAWPRKP